MLGLAGASARRVVRTMKHALRVLVLMMASTSAFGADPVFKSVDARGNVSYGDQAVPGASVVEQVTLVPPPSEAEVLEAQLIGARIQDQAEKLQAERLAREEQEAQRLRALAEEQERQARVAALEAELEAATATTEAAQQERQTLLQAFEVLREKANLGAGEQ